MPHVVTGACIGCRHTDCVTVCPVDCFHEGEEMLYIDPETCTDCDLCVAECPENAIFFDADVPEEQRRFIAINAERALDYPIITEKRSR